MKLNLRPKIVSKKGGVIMLRKGNFSKNNFNSLLAQTDQQKN